MKTEFLRHEYTWSNHCISGNVLGWGITASSVPDDKNTLKQLEKIAAAGIVDRIYGIETEEIVYSPETGFVRLCTSPCECGEDKRENKRVRIYQQKENIPKNPFGYFARAGKWEEATKTDAGSEGYLPPEILEIPVSEPEKLMGQTNIYDRLPDFIQVVFSCLFGEIQELNIVAPHWKKEEFAARSNEIMYALYHLIPLELRKKAGYLSYTEEAVKIIPFYFSQKPLGKNTWNLQKELPKEAEASQKDALDDYFSYYYAKAYVSKDPLYEEFMEKADSYLREDNSAGTQKKILEWIFYDQYGSTHGIYLPKDFLMKSVPELLYWAGKDPWLKEIADHVLCSVHEEAWNTRDACMYFKILTEGYTKRNGQQICKELESMLQYLFETDSTLFEQMKMLLKEKNKIVYTKVMSDKVFEKDSFSGKEYEKSRSDFENLYSYVCPMESDAMPKELKDDILRTGIERLNEDLFQKEKYDLFDNIICRIDRKEQWIKILRDLIGQFKNRTEELTDAQLETAVYVEGMLSGYEGKERKYLKKIWNRRSSKVAGKSNEEGNITKESKKNNKSKSLEAAEDLKKAQDLKEEANIRVLDEEEEEAEEDRIKGPLWKFIAVTFPQGFLTGASMYMANYSLMIGHWKIALGMIGMWVIFLLNFIYMIVQKKEKYSLWKSIGITLVEGYLIQTIPALFLSQKVKLYYFIAIGLCTVLVQVMDIILDKIQENREES